MLNAWRSLVGRLSPSRRRPAPPESRPPEPHPPEPPLRAHALKDNQQLTLEQYAACVDLVGKIQHLYDNAGSYADRKGLDRKLIFPGNEWADIIPTTGLKFRTTYPDLNYLRLHAPFAGYYLMFLDRLDERHFAEPWNDEFLAAFNREGIREDVAEYLSARVDPVERLSPMLEQFRAHLRNVPKEYVVRTPRMFGEIGLEVDDLLANPDTMLCQSRINGLLCSGVLDKLRADIARRGRARVLEIGPGYGPLGAALKDIYGDRLEYVAVDLPSSLLYSTVYLSTLADGDRCHLLMPDDKVPDRFNFLFVANYLLDELGDSLGPIDLAVNTMSFPEMSPEQVRYYAEFLKRIRREDGVVFDENFANKPHHTDSKAILAETFPYRRKAGSDIVVTKNWCQDVWSSTYVKEVFDYSDAALLR